MDEETAAQLQRELSLAATAAEEGRRQAEKQLEELCVSLNAEKRRAEDAEVKADGLVAENAKLRLDSEELRKTNSSLESMRSQLQQKLKEETSAQFRKIEELQKMNEGLTSQCSDVKAQLVAHSNECQRLNEVNEAQSVSLASETAKLRGEIEQLQKQLETRSNECSRLTEAKQAQSVNSNSEVTKLHAELEQLQRLNSNLQDQIQKLKSSDQSSSTSQEPNEVSRAEMEQLRKVNDNLKKEQVDLHRKLQDNQSLTRELTDLQEKLAIKSEQCKKLRLQLEQKSLDAETAALRAEVDQLRTVNATFQSEHDQLQEMLNAKTKECAELIQAASSSNLRNDFLFREAEVKSLQEKLNAALAECNTLRQQSDFAETFGSNASEDIQAKLTAVVGENERLRQQLESMHSDDDIVGLVSSIGAPASKVLDGGGSMSATAQELQAELDSLRQGDVALRRELVGMGSLVNILKKKIAAYEQRMQDQALSCAQELNDMRTRLDQGDEDDGLDDAALWAPALAQLPAIIQKRLSGREPGNYMRWQDEGESQHGGTNKGGEWLSSAPVQRGLFTEKNEKAGTYRPPAIPGT